MSNEVVVTCPSCGFGTAYTDPRIEELEGAVSRLTESDERGWEAADEAEKRAEKLEDILRVILKSLRWLPADIRVAINKALENSDVR